jgi:mannose-6-phosphate isomerase-like protein (cupin superfamily)
MSYIKNIFDETLKNKNFRTTLFTGARTQLVVMDIPPGGEIGEEVHPHVEQALFFLDGQGVSILNGEEKPIGKGDVVIVTPGTRHNFKNTGAEPLKIFTLYAPPNHIDGRIHAIKADADKDVDDEAFGEQVR